MEEKKETAQKGLKGVKYEGKMSEQKEETMSEGARKRAFAIESFGVKDIFKENLKPYTYYMFLFNAIKGAETEKFKTEQQEYVFVGKWLKELYYKMNAKLRKKWLPFAEAYGIFDY